jgi:hypothetical protein
MKAKQQLITLTRESVANALAQLDRESGYVPAGASFVHGRISEANASLFDQAYLSEPLTNYAVANLDTADLDKLIEFYAPAVPAGMRFEYKDFGGLQDFGTDADDLRPIGGDFKGIKTDGTTVSSKLANRGLQESVDEDEVQDDPMWEERVTGRLLRRVKRNILLRAITLLGAAATNVARTWDATAGKDADGDILADLILGGDGAGANPNRVGYGLTAWQKRVTSLRAQTAPALANNSSMTPDELGAWLGVEELVVNKARYLSGSSLAQASSNLVLSFNAQSGLGAEDPSNIKRFIRPLGAGNFRVFKFQVGPKKWIIVVEYYEKQVITSTLGIRKSTIS